jgi:hypothetical protein
VFRSGGVVGSGDCISVLVLRVCVGTLGTGGTSERARVVPMRRELGVVGCRVLSRAALADVAVPRVVTEVVCREDTEVACDEVRTRDAGDEVGVVDTFVRWWAAAVAGLFVTLFGADVVLARGLMRDVVTLFVFVSDIAVQRVDPDNVRLRPKLSGTDRVVDDDGFDRIETREGSFLLGVVGDGVGVVRLSAVWLLVLTASLAGSEPAQRKSVTEHLRNISTHHEAYLVNHSQRGFARRIRSPGFRER